MFKRFVFFAIHLFICQFRFSSWYITIFQNSWNCFIFIFFPGSVVLGVVYRDLHQLFIRNKPENSTLNNSRSPSYLNYTYISHICMHKCLINFFKLKTGRFTLNSLYLFLLCIRGGVHLKFNNSDFLLFRNREVNSIIMAATIIPSPTRLKENITLKFKNMKVVWHMIFFSWQFLLYRVFSGWDCVAIWNETRLFLA